MLWLVSLCSSSQLLRCRVPGRRALCAFLRSPGCTLLGSEAPPSFGQQRRAQKLCCCCWRLLDEISNKGLKLQCIAVVSLCPASCFFVPVIGFLFITTPSSPRRARNFVARPVSCSLACPLGSLGFNSQSRRRFRRLALFVVASQVQLYIRHPPVTSSLRASARNPKNRVKTKLAARYSPSVRQIAWIGKSLPISRIRVSCGNDKLINYSE
jgi:hypothetical protein